MMMVFMHSKRWMLAFILPIVTLTIIGWVSTQENWLHFRPENATPPARVFAVPQVFWVEKYITFDHWTWTEVSKSVLASISLYIICLFDVAGITYSIAKIADLVEPDGNLPGAYWVFLACGLGRCGCTPSSYTLYTPLVHLYCRICTYVHPLYMYIHHIYTVFTPLNTTYTPDVHPRCTPACTPHIHPTRKHPFRSPRP